MPFKRRDEFAAHLATAPSGPVARYARYIAGPDQAAGGHLPCWGAIAKWFRVEFQSDADRLDLWARIKDLDDPRPGFLFLFENENRPAVMRAVAGSAAALSVRLQRVLACMAGIGALLTEDVRKALCADARQIIGSPDLKARERSMFEAWRAQMLETTYHVPDPARPVSTAHLVDRRLVRDRVLADSPAAAVASPPLPAPEPAAPAPAVARPPSRKPSPARKPPKSKPRNRRR